MRIDEPEQLRHALDAGQTGQVRWTVRPEIGPDWIGGGRTVEVLLDSVVLAQTPFLTALCVALCAAVPVPETSEDDVIKADGELTWSAAGWVVQYDGHRAVPYDWPRPIAGTVVFAVDYSPAPASAKLDVAE